MKAGWRGLRALGKPLKQAFLCTEPGFLGTVFEDSAQRPTSDPSKARSGVLSYYLGESCLWLITVY